MSDTNEIDRLKQELEKKTAAMNGFISTIQEKESENKRLIEQRKRQDRRIEELEKLARNQKRTEGWLVRRERVAHQVLDAVTQLLVELTQEHEYQSLSASIKNRISTFIFPKTDLHILDFSKQLLEKAGSNEEFKKLLKEMGFEDWEAITIDLGSPFDYDDPNT